MPSKTANELIPKIAIESPADKTLGPDEKGPKKTVAEKLFEAIGNKGIESPISMVLFGIPILFRMPKSAGEIRAYHVNAWGFSQRVKGYQDELKDPKKRFTVLPMYAEALGGRELDQDDLVTAFYIHYWSHPDTPIGDIEAIKLVAAYPTKMVELVDRIDAEHRSGSFVLSFGQVEQKKRAIESDWGRRVRLEGAALMACGKHPDDMDDAELDRLDDFAALWLIREDEDNNRMKALAKAFK